MANVTIVHADQINRVEILTGEQDDSKVRRLTELCRMIQEALMEAPSPRSCRTLALMMGNDLEDILN